MTVKTLHLIILISIWGSATVSALGMDLPDADAKNPKIFNVSDFGAVGDGETDDGPAIREAVAAAVAAAPGSIVVFEEEIYRLAAHFASPYQIDLEGVSGITLAGHGATLVNHPANNLLSIRGSRDITVRGFFFDCAPLPFTQGRITRVEPEEGAFFVRIEDGYDNPVQVYRELGKKPQWGWGVCMDPVKRERKRGVLMHLYIEDVTEVDADRGLIRVQLADRARQEGSAIERGDRFVITMKYGGHGGNIEVKRSADVRLGNYTFYAAKFGMTHSISDNFGRVHVKGVNITFKPGSNHLISSPKDGFHCKHNAIGPIIEDGLFEGMLDDTINISVTPYWVKQDLGNNRYLIAELWFSPREGDRLMAYTPETGLVTRGLVVLSLEPQAGRGVRGDWNIITLNKPIPDVRLHEGGNLFPGGPDKLKFTGLYNIDASGEDYIVRNNFFKAQRRHGVLARTSGGLIEGNTFDGLGGSGVYLSNEIGSFYEGPFPANTTIRKNSFHDTVGTPIVVMARGNNAWAENIVIENNTFSAWPDSAMRLDSLSESRITGNIIESGEPGSGEPIVVLKSQNVVIKRNDVR